MNYAHFAEYVRNIEDDLVRKFGVPSLEAANIATYIEASAVSAEARQRKEDQMRLDFRTHEVSDLAKRYDVTDRTIRVWKAKLFDKPELRKVGT
jgi:hypothetical protein